MANVFADSLDDDDNPSEPVTTPYDRGGETHVALLWLLALALVAAVAALVWVLLRFAPAPFEPDRGRGSAPPTPDPGSRGQLPEDFEPGASA